MRGPPPHSPLGLLDRGLVSEVVLIVTRLSLWGADPGSLDRMPIGIVGRFVR